jgi:hypothetical protein
MNTLAQPEIWQEYDCPDSGIDFDIDEGEIVAVGEQFYCCGCGQKHTATLGFPKNTCVRLLPGGDLEFRRTPRDATEKAEWLAEVYSARLKTPNFELGDHYEGFRSSPKPDQRNVTTANPVELANTNQT